MKKKQIKVVKEGLFDDPGNRRALSTWFHTEDEQMYVLEVKEPFKVIIRDSQKGAILLLLNANRIPYTLNKVRQGVTENLSEGILKFSDGEEINTDGPLRADKRRDGWYVVGEGKLIPVGSYKEAIKLIKKMEGLKNI